MTPQVRNFRHYASAFLGVAGFAAAFPVYHNTAAHLPIATAFFWFSAFALLTSFAYPNDCLAGFAPGLRATARLRAWYPRAPWSDWIASLHRGGGKLLALTIIAHLVTFVLLLTVLRMRQPAVVVTVLVIQQLGPPLNTAVAYRILNDTCARWDAYIVGTIMTITGILLYKSARITATTSWFDIVVFLTMLGVLCGCVLRMARTKYRRTYGVDALETMRSTQVAGTLMGGMWMTWDGAVLPDAQAFAGLAFLGIVSTAVSGILVNRAQDVIGMPATESISSIRPLLLIPLGLLPCSAISTPHLGLLGVVHYAGIMLSIIGICIVFLIARPMSVGQHHRT